MIFLLEQLFPKESEIDAAIAYHYLALERQQESQDKQERQVRLAKGSALAQKVLRAVTELERRSNR